MYPPTLKLEKRVQLFYMSLQKWLKSLGFFLSNLYFFKKESYWKIRTILLFNFISNNCIVLTKITFWIPRKCILKNCGFYSWLKDFISFVIYVLILLILVFILRIFWLSWTIVFLWGIRKSKLSWHGALPLYWTCSSWGRHDWGSAK